MESVAKQLVTNIDRKALVDLACDLIRIPSPRAEETAVARWLAQYFAERGYDVDLQEVEPGRFQAIAMLRGIGGGKKLMLNGHLDNDPLSYGWKRDPWTPSVEGDLLYGAGSWNMKCGVATMIAVAETIRQSGVKLKGDLVLACVAGELQGGLGTVHMLQSGVCVDMAVVLEPYGIENLVTTNAGATEMAISTIGYSRHIGAMEHAIDAIDAMMKVIPAIKGVQFRHSPRPDMPALPRLSVGCIIGGRGRDHDLRGPNWTCDYCTILVDIRFLPGQTAEGIEEEIRAAIDSLKASHPKLKYEIEHPPHARYRAYRRWMPPMDVAHDEYVVQSVSRHYTALTGKKPKTIGTLLPLSYASNDTGHLQKAGIPCVVYGPGGGNGNAEEPDHYVDINEMVCCAQVLTLVALDVCNLPLHA